MLDLPYNILDSSSCKKKKNRLKRAIQKLAGACKSPIN